MQPSISFILFLRVILFKFINLWWFWLIKYTFITYICKTYFLELSYAYFEVIFYLILFVSLNIAYIIDEFLVRKDSFNYFNICWIKLISFSFTCIRVLNVKIDFPKGIFLKMHDTIFCKLLDFFFLLITKIRLKLDAVNVCYV